MANLEIKRFLREKKAVTKTICKAGKVTVLIDESGDGALVPYTNAVTGKKTEDRFQFFYDGKLINSNEMELVGFGEKLPEKLTLQEYLIEIGFERNELAKIISEFDLEQSSYLTCGQLNSTISRQLILLKALKSKSPIMALNDPFLPFNGRWRSDFAEKIQTHATDNGMVVLVVNLSFIPEVWTKNELIGFIDVGKAAERAKKKAEAKEILADQVAAAAAGVPEETKTPEEKRNQKGLLDYVLPEHLVFAYREKVDWLFGPLADMSSTLRDYSGVGMPLALAFVVVALGATMVPNIGYYQDKLHVIADNWDYEEYKKLQEANAKKIKARFTKEVKNSDAVILDPNSELSEEVEDVAQAETVGELVKAKEITKIHKIKVTSDIEIFNLCPAVAKPVCESEKKSCYNNFRDYVKSGGYLP
ncbi:MAG: hypothetical protein R3A13_10270 [Bdellovibrionota bacterium]